MPGQVGVAQRLDGGHESLRHQQARGLPVYLAERRAIL